MRGSLFLVSQLASMRGRVSLACLLSLCAWCVNSLSRMNWFHGVVTLTGRTVFYISKNFGMHLRCTGSFDFSLTFCHKFIRVYLGEDTSLWDWPLDGTDSLLPNSILLYYWVLCSAATILWEGESFTNSWASRTHASDSMILSSPQKSRFCLWGSLGGGAWSH